MLAEFIGWFLRRLDGGSFHKTWELPTGYTKPKEGPMPDRYPSVKEFLAAFKPIGQEMETKFGIPWLLTATQAAHESRNGNSGLAQHNNLFGVTADKDLTQMGVPATMAMQDVKVWLLEHPTAPITIMKTNEVSEYPPEKIHYWTRPGDVISKTPHGAGSDLLVERPFRTYADWREATRAWVERIIKNYSLAYACATDLNAKGFFEGLQAGGYATDQQYASQLKARYDELSKLA